MQSDMKKVKELERKKQNCHGLQMIWLRMECKGLELRVCLACWRNTEEVWSRVRKRGCGRKGGRSDNSIIMASNHPSQALCWALESNVEFSPQSYI